VFVDVESLLSFVCSSPLPGVGGGADEHATTTAVADVANERRMRERIDMGCAASRSR
jgi:hypothetical protein